MDNPVSSIFGLFLQLLFYAVVLGVVILFARSIFWFMGLLIGRFFGFIAGIIADLLQLVVNAAGILVHAFIAVVLLVVGSWQAANARAERFGASLASALGCLVAIGAYRPLRLFCLDQIANSMISSLPPAFVDCRRLQIPLLHSISSGPAHGDSSSAPIDSPAGLVSEARSIFDDYTIVDSLPSGGSGARLWVAEPSGRKRRRLMGAPHRVVIKSFDLHGGSTLPSIVRESRALEGARRIGLVLEHQLEAHRFWYVMPYHPGSTLTQMVEVLHRSGKGPGFSGIELSSGLNYVRDLLRTLAHFHQSGLWHKDVKPDNLIVHDGRAHLVDLGLVSSLSSSLTLTTHGTEYFRDPELVRMALRGVKVQEIEGAKFDVFGAGAVLYFILANDFPAQGGLSRFQSPVPPVLDWIVRRAMADYSKRYTSAEEMLADLDAACRNADVWSMLPADLPSLCGRPAPDVAAPGALDALSGAPPLGSPPPPPVVSSRRAGSPSLPPVSGTAGSVPGGQTTRKDRPSPLLVMLGILASISIALGFMGLVSGFSFSSTPVVAIHGSDYPSPDSDWQQEALFLPRSHLAVLALESPDSESQPVILAWSSSALDESEAMNEALEAALHDFSSDGYFYDEVAEPRITQDLQAELQRFPMPVTRHDGSLAPPMGLFRVADRIGLQAFSFLGDDGGIPSFHTYTPNDGEWRLGVRLPAPTVN